MLAGPTGEVTGVILSSDTGFVRHGDAGDGVEEEFKGSRCSSGSIHGTAVLFDKG